MKQLIEKYKDVNFTVENYAVDITWAAKLWKKTYKDFPEFHAAIIAPARTASYDEFGEDMLKEWNDIPDITISEAFSEKNVEIRRLCFKAIGVIELFKALDPELIHKDRIFYDNIITDSIGVQTKIATVDVYELYKIDGNKLFPEETSEWRTDRATIYAVRCWCTTTKREYWIYVPRIVGEKNNALEAIAWTIRLEHTNPQYLHRQGDVIVTKLSDKSEPCSPRHLSAEEYVNLLKSAS
jgi:hypothetical protein